MRTFPNTSDADILRIVARDLRTVEQLHARCIERVARISDRSLAAHYASVLIESLSDSAVAADAADEISEQVAAEVAAKAAPPAEQTPEAPPAEQTPEAPPAEVRISEMIAAAPSGIARRLRQ